VYSGSVRSSACSALWYVGTDAHATYTCAPGGYRIRFRRTAVAGSLSHIKASRRMVVDADVRALARGTKTANPAVGCYVDDSESWVVQLGKGSAWMVSRFGAKTPVKRGVSRSVRDLARDNHVVLLCDDSGTRLRLTLRVNGRVLLREADAGPSGVAFSAFGLWGVGDIGSTVEMTRIVATTGWPSDPKAGSVEA
jgi:hypothetical protein